jgi:predicted Zn-dependent protease
MLPYSRSHETQSDRIGLMIAARSGFDPRAAITFWNKMAESSQSTTPEFLSTHPGYDTRIETLTEAMPEAMQYYQASRKQ